MEVFSNGLSRSVNYLSTMGISDFLDIIIVAYLIYKAIGFVRRTNSNNLAKGLVVFLLALWGSDIFSLTMINFLLRKTAELGLIALLILFQPELRRLLERMGSGFASGRSSSGTVMDSAISQTVQACCDMSASKTGALIIFERDNRLDDQIRTGTILDAETTAELLKNIFYPKAPLHDGAAIIRSGRIQAAGCMLPLSNNPNLSKELGMRHRAGIGMSEASDAVVVIVSEETGAISVAVNGMLKRHLTKDTFEKILRNELIPEVKEEPTGAFRFLRRKEKDKADE